MSLGAQLSVPTIKRHDLWAICPFLPLTTRSLITGPLVFDSRHKAEAFLKETTVVVYDGWGRGEEKNFKSREEWLREIASWINRPLDPSLDLVESGLSPIEIMSAQKQRAEHMMARLAAAPRRKRVTGMPDRLGADVYMSPWPRKVRVAEGDLIGIPLPVHKLGIDSGPTSSLRLADLKPEELNPTPVSTIHQHLDMCLLDPHDDWMC